MTIRQRNILYILGGTLVLLLVPLVAMQFTDEINWGWEDFATAGILLLGAGLTYEFTVRQLRDVTLRYTVAVLVALVFVLIWVQLAVGIF